MRLEVRKPSLAGSETNNGAAASRASRLGVCLALLALTAVVYARTTRFDFVNFDDADYLTGNRHVQEGLTRASLAWAFTSTRSANWHPLTWLSHMLDWRLYGARAGGHHATSVALHLANTLLLLVALSRLTGLFWPSAFVAALFAVHPLHVESVAWISERKDVLSTAFGLLALSAYARYAQSLLWRHYLAVLLGYALSLMSKPMWVTFTFLLLLLDCWPLGRLPYLTGCKTGARAWPVIREKIPFLALSLVSCAVTYWAQRKGGAITPVTALPIESRIENALTSYAAYLEKLLWPSGLACFYPFPREAPGAARVFAMLAVVAAVTFLSLRARRRHPYLAVGWFWYLGMLVPVIGLVQVGSQAMADRYTYIPSAGIFLMIAWGVSSLRAPSAPLWLPASAVTLALAALGWVQVGYWRDSETLFRRALAVTSENSFAHNNLGVALMNEGKLDEALAHYQESVRIDGDRFNPRFNLGRALARKGRLDEAVAEYSQAIRLKPDYADAYSELCAALARLLRGDEAVAACRKALEIDPEHAAAYNNLAVALVFGGDLDGARQAYGEAIRLNPDYYEARSNLGALLARQGSLDEAIVQFREALGVQPSYRSASNNLIRALYLKGEYAAAWREVERSKALGVDLEQSFIAELAGKMPAPGRKE
jgi:tetratricopeptide (TPR) repeat protein